MNIKDINLNLILDLIFIENYKMLHLTDKGRKVAKLRTGIFLGGEILNPSSRNVTLYQGANVVEMLDLNSNLRFERKYDSLQSGIYKLEHLPEYQTLLLESLTEDI